jgi:hypothetical protein
VHTTGTDDTVAGTMDFRKQSMSEVLNKEMGRVGQHTNINFCCEREKSITGTMEILQMIYFPFQDVSVCATL